MNSNTLKISGSAELPQALEMGKEYQIQLQGEILTITKRNEQDGSFTYTHTLKPVLVEILGERENIKAIPKGSSSQKWRNAVGAIKGFEEYDKLMGKMLLHADQVIEFVDNL